MIHRNDLCRVVKLAGLALVAFILLGAEPTAADHDEIVRKTPLDPEAYYNRAMYYRARGEYEKSIADFNQAARIYAAQLELYRAASAARVAAPAPVSYSGPIDRTFPRAKTVPVRGYFRKDGTYVSPYMRSLPTRGGRGGRGGR